MVLRLAIRPTRKTSGVEVRHGTFDVVVDGERVGSSELHDTFEAKVEPGPRTPKSAMAETQAELRPSRQPRAKSSPATIGTIRAVARLPDQA